MKKLSLLLLIVPFILMGQDNSSSINNVTHIQVKMGHEAQFVEGVKMYKKCYSDNGGEGKWNFWKQVQGTNAVYAVTDVMENWAEMDEDGEKFKDVFEKTNGAENWQHFLDLGANSFSNSWDEIWSYNAHMSGK